MTPYAPKRRNSVSASYDVDINFLVSAFLKTTQDRSKKLYSETTLGSSIINGLVRFVIGPGLEAQASPENSILGWDEDTRGKFIAQSEAFFRMFAGSKDIDFYKRDNFNSIQVIALRNILVSGDVLQHRSYRNKANAYAPYLQILSGQWVRNPSDASMDNKELIGGVRFNAKGQEIGYYIAETLDNLEDAFTSKYVSKVNSYTGFEEYNLIKILAREANQVRGIPWLTPVIEDLLDMETFKAAYKTKAITQSLLTGVIESEPEAPTPTVSTLDTIRGLDVRENKEALPADDGDVKLGSGNIIALNPGEKMTMMESKVPATAYAEYMKTELSSIGAAVSLPYELLLQSYNASFSASRATIGGAEKGFRVIREEFATKFCAPVWEQVVDYGIRMGYITAPGYLEGDDMTRRAVLASTWIGPSPVVVNPVQEVNAHILAINANLETREHALRELYSTDFEETVERLRREQDMLMELLDEGSEFNDREENEDEER